MTTDAGSAFDDQTPARDAGDDRLTEADARHRIAEDAGDRPPDEDREREQVREDLNDAF
jgi:hypothetical protein